MCFPNCAKYLLVVLNIALFVAGASIFVAGLLLLLETGLLNSDVIRLLNYIEYGVVKVGLLLQAICYMMIALGAMTMIFSVVGSCGAWKKIKCCLLVFVFFMVIIIMVQGALVGLWISLSGRSDEWLQGKMTKLLEFYHGPTYNEDHVSSGYNQLFMRARCCGVESWADMENLPTPWFTNEGNGNSENIPATCCKGVDTDEDIANSISGTCTTTPTDYYTEGCYYTLRDKFNQYLLIMDLVSGIGLIIEVTAIVLSCMVLDQTKNRIRSGPINNGPAKPPPPYVGIDAVLKNKKTPRRI